MQIVRLGEGVDRTGRLDPAALQRTFAALREYAGISKEVVWAGMTQNIEIWSKERWIDVEREAREDPEALSESLAELGL